jgi:mannose-1-phosphate guanylyltransferase/phosphomannomutase
VPDIPILHSEVETPFEQKGLVMRTLMEQLVNGEGEVILVDGIKVRTDAGWVLVVPDPEEPSTHIWAEGTDWVSSERLTEDYVARMRDILR